MMVTRHAVMTLIGSVQISISSLKTHIVNRLGKSRHLARKLSLMRKLSSPNVFDMAATETILCFFQVEDGIRSVAVTGVQTCSSDLRAVPEFLLPRSRARAPLSRAARRWAVNWAPATN